MASKTIKYLLFLSLLGFASGARSIIAGFPITFRNEKNCTVGFIGNNEDINGFITSALCCARDNCNILNGEESDEVYEVIGNDGSNDLNLIGAAYDIKFELGYIFVTSILEAWNNIPYTKGVIPEVLYPVTSYLTLNFKGDEVCAYGAKSGFFCGTLDEINASISILNPLTDKLDVLNVNKVHLGLRGFGSFEDMGGPVYKRIDHNGNMTAQALVSPICIFQSFFVIGVVTFAIGMLSKAFSSVALSIFV
ncbi:542_t:CDS:2, partial [Gigaspora rosea]